MAADLLLRSLHLALKFPLRCARAAAYAAVEPAVEPVAEPVAEEASRQWYTPNFVIFDTKAERESHTTEMS